MHLSFFSPKKQAICFSYTKLPNAFLQLNVKTKIPLLKKKKKKSMENWQTAYLCQPSENMETRSANSPGKLLLVSHLLSYMHFTSYPAFQFCTRLPISNPKRLKSKLLLGNSFNMKSARVLLIACSEILGTPESNIYSPSAI